MPGGSSRSCLQLAPGGTPLLGSGFVQERKTLKTRTLTRVECVPGSDTAATLCFRRQFTSGDERLALSFPTPTLRLEFLGVLSAFCR